MGAAQLSFDQVAAWSEFSFVLAGILGNLVSGVLGFLGQERTNAANRSMANAQMAFQGAQNDEARDFSANEATRSMEFGNLQARMQENFQRDMMHSAMAYNTNMSNTSYRRGMADMKEAGLNPILAFGQGGATAPSIGGASGASASGAMGSSPTASGASAVMGNSLGAAISAAGQVAQIEQALAGVDRTKAETGLISEQQHQVRASTATEVARAITEGVRPDLIRAQTSTERGRPAALGAQVARDTASAAQLRAQTTTEAERPAQVRAETGATIHRGNLMRTQEGHLRNYGPSGQPSSIVGTISTVIDQIRRALQ